MKSVCGFLRGAALAGAMWAGTAWGAADLVVSYVTVTNGTTVYPGDTLKIQSGTKNVGADSTGWWYYGDVYYYFGTSTNDLRNQIGSGWTPNANEPNGISVNEVEDDEISWTLPADTAPGTYYVIARADATGKCPESNENNNLRSVKLTVLGIPSFKNVQWNGLRFVSDGDTAIAYGECVNIPAGATVTVKLYEDDLAGDDLIATWSVKTQRGTNGVYFAKTWAAEWEDDASGDPEYYFTCSYTAYGKTATGNSGETEGAYLHVAAAEARMTPSPVKGDFYYDNDSGSGSSVTGASSGTVPLTDDRIPIILVHGMSGDAKPKTLNYWYGWMNADTGGTLGYFNQSPMSSMFRVYRYVYDSTDYISTNAAKFAQFVNDFYAAHTNFNERQVVIMAHSMGGLVSRYAMNTNPDFAAKVHRLVTLGSPHQGSQGANPTWIKYSGPDEDSWFISGIYNTFKLHNNTAGCFDLAWYATNQIPAQALTESAIAAMSDTYQPALLRNSLKNPFCGWSGMVATNKHDYKMVMFGGSSTNQIGDYLSKDWPSEPSGEVKTDHLGLWVATKIFRSMSYADGRGVGDNDGLVPLNSALLSDGNRHPKTAKINLNETEGQQVDHASYLDVPVTMDSVKTRLLTIVRGFCEADASLSAADKATVAAQARWRLIDPNTDEEAAWQKSEVRLPALTPGVQYTVEFKPVSGFNKPGNVKVTAVGATTKIVRGTYTKTTAVNHAPTSLSLDNASVDENAPAGTVVGTLSATDPDGDTLNYSLVAGDGDTGNSCFRIDGIQLKTTIPFDYEEYPAHYCRIRVRDSGGLYLEQEFTIAVNNLADEPSEATGDAWLNLQWDPVEGATAYRVDVTACGATETHLLPGTSLGTNEFRNGQEWMYLLPGGVAPSVSGNTAVKRAPQCLDYEGIPTHFIAGTNNIGIQTAPIPLNGAAKAVFAFTNGAWNGQSVTSRVTVAASYRIDGGDWVELGTSVPTKATDGGDVRAEMTVSRPAGNTIEFKVVAPEACILPNSAYLRGAYIRYGAVVLEGAGGGGEYGTGCSLPGYPVVTEATGLRVSGLPAGAPYWYTVEALVGDEWVAAESGTATARDGLDAPTGLLASDETSGGFILLWDEVAGATKYNVQISDVTAGGTPTTLATVPNVNLSDASFNKSGWHYAANHAVVTSNWLCDMDSSYTNADYHGLTTKFYPGLQSPEMDLSGYTNAFVQFTMRRRGVTSGSTTAWLYWKTAETGWTRAGSVSTNVDAIYNGRYLTLEVPPEAMAPGAMIEVRSDDATGTNKWSGIGVGIRNLSFSATPVGGPDFEAASAFEVTTDDAGFLFEGLDPKTTYYVRVQAADDQGNVSEWSTTAFAVTTPNTAPHDLTFFAEVDEAQPAGTLVGLMEAIDDDGDALTYELVDGVGDTHNASFVIAGDELLLAEKLFYADGATRTVRIRASDPSGAYVEKACEVAVVQVKKDDLPAIVPHLEAAAGGYRMTWPPVDGIEKYAILVSTNLLDVPAFAYSTIVTNENPSAESVVFDDTVEGPMKFWVIQPVAE